VNKKKKTALFSIEIAARELLPKCLLTLETAKLGMRVYIGSFRALKQLDGKVDSCIFFHKSTWKRNAARLRKTIGATFVFLDEEMGMALPESQTREYLDARFVNVSAENYPHVFSIGEQHKQHMDTFENFKGVQNYPVGWPRIDLWREKFNELYSDEIQRIRNKEGEFYLLVSSFGAISESSYQESIDSHIKYYSSDTAVIDFKYDEFKSCLKLIKDLSPKLQPHEKIVIRPHTSESLEEWEILTVDYANVVIRHQGDVTPWLLASTGTIQFGSTVAVQAALMGVPSVKLATMQNIPGLTDTISYEVLPAFNSSDDIYQYLQLNQGSGAIEHKQKTINQLKEIVASLEGELASTKIAHILNELEIAPQPPIRFNHLRRFYLWLKERINYLNYLKSKLLRKERGRLKRSKFEKIPNGLTAKEIGDHLEKLAYILGDDPKRIHCRQVAHNLVEIEYN